MQPGKVYKVTFQPIDFSNYFKPGHRLRLEISSSNFPRFDRNMNTGGNNYDEKVGLVAQNAVHHDKQYPSAVTITVVPSGGGGCCEGNAVHFGSYDQRPVEARNDVLVYTTEPFKDGVEMSGPITVTL